MTNTINKLEENYLYDLKKQKINKYERAIIIRNYLNKNKISIRELSKKIDIPKSTIEDWLLFERLPINKYQELIKAGITEKQIYKELRNNKNKKYKDFNPIEHQLERLNRILYQLDINLEKNKPQDKTRLLKELEKAKQTIRKIEYCL